MNKAKIHNDSLINNYLPADYLDSFSKEVVVNKNITPDTFFDMVFNRFPAWIDWLLKLRNKIVKPLGLDTTSRFPDSVCERSANEIIWGMPDKHLNFNVSMWCDGLVSCKCFDILQCSFFQIKEQMPLNIIIQYFHG